MDEAPPLSGRVAAVPAPRPWRLGERATLWFDVALASALLLPTVPFALSLGWAWTAFAVAEIVPLYWRRRHPAIVFAVVAAASAAQAVVLDTPVWGQVAFPVALYSLARFGRPGHARIGLVVGLCGALVAAWVWNAGPAGTSVSPEIETLAATVLMISAIVVAAWALGTQARSRRAYEKMLVERGRRLAAEAERRAMMAAAEERTRIAREMHDVVAHGLSVVVVQADGARYAAERDPAVAVRTLGVVAETGREALTEMRRLLGLLRGSGDVELTPQPGLTDLPALAGPGGRVHLDLPDPLPVVPDGIALTAYRIVQESLTNVRKHAGPSALATVTVRARPDVLEVEVCDDGDGAASLARPPRSEGLGLVGMRERVEVHDGSLVTGPAPGGGWRVRARIPT